MYEYFAMLVWIIYADDAGWLQLMTKEVPGGGAESGSEASQKVKRILMASCFE